MSSYIQLWFNPLRYYKHKQIPFNMKKLLAILIVCGVSYTASAQHGRGSHGRVRSHVSIGIGSPGYYGNSYNSYNRFYSPFNNNSYRNYNRPSRLDLAVQDIENEYRDRIWSVKRDRSLSRQQRKTMVKNMRYERDKAIRDARRGYYKRNY